MMTYDEISPVMRGFLGAWEAFRKLGFRADDLYCEIARSELNGGLLSCFVTLRAQRKIFHLEVGPVEGGDGKAFTAEWKRVCEAMNARRVEEKDLDRIYQESIPFRLKADFIVALSLKGFKIPKSLS